MVNIVNTSQVAAAPRRRLTRIFGAIDDSGITYLAQLLGGSENGIQMHVGVEQHMA